MTTCNVAALSVRRVDDTNEVLTLMRSFELPKP
jgi:hypothetical protein